METPESLRKAVAALDKAGIDTQEIKSAGILWHPLRYHSRPSALATSYDILFGIALGLWLVLTIQLKLKEYLMHQLNKKVKN